MVEIFKTNVQQNSQAKKLVALLCRHFPESKINFDLEDCDRILRVEAFTLQATLVMETLNHEGFFCAELED